MKTPNKMPLLLPRRYRIRGINTKVRRYEGTKVPSFNEGNICNAMQRRTLMTSYDNGYKDDQFGNILA